MAELSVTAPVSVGERIYFYNQFGDKVYILSSPVAEIEVLVNKSGTNYVLHTNTGLTFNSKNKDIFFTSEEAAIKALDDAVKEVNLYNEKIGSGKIFYAGGIIK